MAICPFIFYLVQISDIQHRHNRINNADSHNPAAEKERFHFCGFIEEGLGRLNAEHIAPGAGEVNQRAKPKHKI